MMKEKINDTEPGIKQIEREIERGVMTPTY